MNKEFYVIVFKSVHYAIKAEHTLKGKFEIKIMPTPREISASCGVSIRISKSDLEAIKETLQASIDEFNIYELVESGEGKRAIKMD